MTSRKATEYKSGIKPIWCPGCGDYGVLSALMRAFAELDLPPENIAVASGIGCSSRFPAFIKTYGFHGVHGRALPLATGIKLGNPDITVVAVGGDGDGFSIGGGHISHAARRNVPLTYIVMDNSIYGMTKGQPSPTSPTGLKRKASPYGAVEAPLNPMLMLLSYQASFVARAFAGQLKPMVEIFKEALLHPGFAFVQVLSPCITFFDTYANYREIAQPLPADHDESDLLGAMKLALDTETQHLGVFYRDVEREPYTHLVHKVQTNAPEMPLQNVLEGFRR